MFCFKCGSQQPDDAKYCSSCGTALLRAGDSATSRDDLAQAATETNPTTSPATAKTRTPSTKYIIIIVAAIVVAVLLGVIIFNVVSALQSNDTSATSTESAQTAPANETGQTGDAPTATSKDQDGSERSGANTASQKDSSKDDIPTTEATPEEVAAQGEDRWVEENESIPAGMDERYLRKPKIENLDTFTLYLARNEILARHGRKFKNQDLRDYFNSRTWYKPKYSPEEFDSKHMGELNEYEKANIDIILEVEREKGSPYI